MDKDLNLNFDYIFKLIIIGDSFVGKTAILNKFLLNKFNENYDITVGVEFGTKIIDFDKFKIKLQIWDTAGQQSFQYVTRSYYKSTSGAIIVFDLSKKESFLNIQNWLKNCEEYSNKTVSIILVGNKNDISEREVEENEIQEFIKNKNDLEYIETSAKNGNVSNIFSKISEKILEKLDKGIIDINNENQGVKPGIKFFEKSESEKLSAVNLNISDNKKKKKCC